MTFMDGWLYFWAFRKLEFHAFVGFLAGLVLLQVAGSAIVIFVSAFFRGRT